MGELDRTISLAINSLHCPASDAFWIFLSDRFTTAVIYIIILGIMFWKLGWKKALLMLLTTAIILGIEDQICNIIKDGIARLRPGNDPIMLERGLHLPIPASARHIYGFPSAHAANAFGFLTCVAFFFHAHLRGSLDGQTHGHHHHCFRSSGEQVATGVINAKDAAAAKWTVSVLCVWAVLISLSRVFLAKHYVGDILFGAFLGWLIALFGCHIAIILWRRFAKK